MLPYAPEFLTDIAAQAIEGACWKSDTFDQFLTMLAMEDMSDYDGDGDFGTLTRIDLDDELRVVMTLVDLISSEGGFSERNLECLISHYRNADVLLGYGGDQRWWADWHWYTTAEAEKEQASFAAAYSEYLGDDE